MQSLAILGRQPKLGLAELESLYGSASVTPIGQQAARIGLDACQIDSKRLGGTVKLCKILTVLDTTRWKDIEQFLVSSAPDHSRQMPEGKMLLGLSAYGLDISPSQLLATGLSVKKAIHKQTGRTVRLVPNKSPALNTPQVLHNKLTGDHGWELVFVPDDTRTVIAQTLLVQDIEDYTLRDRSRPKRDPRVGMLPPKLAQLIINLAVGPAEFAAIKDRLPGGACLSRDDEQAMRAARQGSTLLDPFCGTGVVLQEALLMGYQVCGTDIGPRMVGYSRVNIGWLAGRYQLPAISYELTTGDATTYHWQCRAGIVATETYLGRPFTAPPSSELLAQTAAECNLIIKKFLQNVRSQLQPSTRLCLAVPAWQTRPAQFKHLPLIDQLSDMGYNRIRFAHVRDEELLYYRPGQIVARELLVLTRR